MNRVDDGDPVVTVERDCFTCGNRFSDFADIFECPRCLPRGHRQCLNPDCLRQYSNVYDYLGCPRCEPRHHRIPVHFAESVVRTTVNVARLKLQGAWYYELLYREGRIPSVTEIAKQIYGCHRTLLVTRNALKESRGSDRRDLIGLLKRISRNTAANVVEDERRIDAQARDDGWEG